MYYTYQHVIVDPHYYCIREKFQGRKVSRFYSNSESFTMKYLYIVTIIIEVSLQTRIFLHVLFSVYTTVKLFCLETFHVYGISILNYCFTNPNKFTNLKRSMKAPGS